MALAALFDGRLAPAEQEALYLEMSRCPLCQETLALVGLGIADEAQGLAEVQVPRALDAKVRGLLPAQSVVDRVAGIVVRRLRGVLESLAEGLAPQPMPALALRGAGASSGLRFEIEAGVPIELLLVDGGAAGTRVTVRPLAPPVPRSRVVLARGEAVEASLALDARGVQLPALGVGRYELRFEVPGGPTTVLPLELGGEAD